jgi:hypothetical protein
MRTIIVLGHAFGSMPGLVSGAKALIPLWLVVAATERGIVGLTSERDIP